MPLKGGDKIISKKNSAPLWLALTFTVLRFQYLNYGKLNNTKKGKKVPFRVLYLLHYPLIYPHA